MCLRESRTDRGGYSAERKSRQPDNAANHHRPRQMQSLRLRNPIPPSRRHCKTRRWTALGLAGVAGRSAAMERRKRSVESPRSTIPQERGGFSVAQTAAVQARYVTRREDDGGIRYVIRSPGGQRVSAAEIDTLKRRLREQRGRQAEEIHADALSYQPEPRRALGATVRLSPPPTTTAMSAFTKD